MTLKSLLDAVISFLLLILLSPLMVLISFLVFVELREIPIYIQERGLSLSKNCFRLYKFKTMKIHSGKSGDHNHSILLKQNLISFVSFSGRLLRRTGLDELPQLINVLKGEMSLVGPRPLSIEDLNQLQKNEKELYERRDKLSIKPGITGLWQIFGERERGIENLINLDELYQRERNLFLDFALLLKTIPLIFLAKHSDSILPLKKMLAEKIKISGSLELSDS